METKKPFWKTSSGLLIGCLALVVLALLCVCLIMGVMFLNNSSSTPTPATPVTSTTQSSRIITDIVMAKNVQGVGFDPIDVTYAFPATQSIFHAVVTIKDAPKDTAVGVIWSTEKGQRMGEFEIKGEGSRNLDFSFQPDGGKLPPGNYKVDIRVNGTPERTMNFTVQEPSAQSSALPSPLPTVAFKPTTAAPPTSLAPKPSAYVNSVTLAEGVQGVNKDPLNPTTIFGPNSTFHAVVRSQNAPANTKFKVSWYVVDVGNVVPPNSLIDETDITTDGSRNIDFLIAPPATKWPAGKYRVESFVNDVLDRVVNFSVAGTTVAPTVAPTRPPTTAPTPAGLTCGNGVLEPGMVGVYVTNNFDGELLFAIASRSYKIPGHSTLLVQVASGKPFTYSATITGVGTLTAGPYTFDPGTCVPFTPQK